MKKTFCFLSLFFCLVTACDDDNEAAADCSCLEACTDALGFLFVKISQNGVYVRLDSQKTFLVESGKYELLPARTLDSLEVIMYQEYLACLEDPAATDCDFIGSPLLSNENLSDVDICGSEMEFIGYKDGKEIVREPYLIRSNCCYLEIVSGKTEIILP